MAEFKTIKTDDSVTAFLHAFTNSEQRRKESFELIELMLQITGFEPKMSGPSIIGFGHYHYKYDSGHEGQMPLVGFSPRKAAFSLYVFTGLEKHHYLLEHLGKFKRGKACIYVNKLADIDLEVLTTLVKETINYLKLKYGEN
jgi:hypothetical protein